VSEGRPENPNEAGSDTPTEKIVLDACCLINLFATGRIRDILVALPARLAVATYVAKHEALYVLSDPLASDPGRDRIDVEALAAEGLLNLLDLESDEELASYVELAARLEDGEAYTSALAIHRGYTLATDERKVLHLFRTTFPSVRLRTTSNLLKQWADLDCVPTPTLREVLGNVRLRARFIPNRQDPLCAWWIGHL
jgi:hypothetical protein